MSLFDVFAIVITLAAVFGWLNGRTLRLPTAIGITLASLILSLALIGLHEVGLATLDRWAQELLDQVPFSKLVMQGLLSFLLFAGSLHVELNELTRNRWPVLVLATAGVVVSTLLVGTAIWWLLGLLGMGLPYLWALVFGALISPTDPIAVMSILKDARTPVGLHNLITGESLFNDGVGVVVFTALLDLAMRAGGSVPLERIAVLFLREAVGGLGFGLVLGLVAYQGLKWIDNYVVEVLITLAVVTGGYALAGALHTSGPLAMVVAGLFLGNRGRRFAMSDRTLEHLDTFWELVDEILNAVLFALIGMELLVIDVPWPLVLVGLAAVAVVLAARLVSVGTTISLLRLNRRYGRYTVRLMTWGGLRGGISIALALSLPQSEARGLIVAATYVVVVFSILVQGLTVGRLARRVMEHETARATEQAPAEAPAPQR